MAPIYRLTRVTLAILLSTSAMLIWSSDARAQQAFYTFTSGLDGDGFDWDFDEPPFGLNDLPIDETFLAPTTDGLGFTNIENFSGNVTFFDSAYQAAGNSLRINGDAWWGNPDDNLCCGAVGASFINNTVGFAESVSFDFAWALAGDSADDFIEVEVYDEEFDSAFLFFELPDTFNAGPAFGGFDGREGTISFDLVDAQNENIDVDAIVGFSIDVSSVSTLGGTGEFAIDNLSVDGGGQPTGSNVFPSFNSGQNGTGTTFNRNVLRNTGTVSITQSVTNNGTEATTYSTQIVAGGDLADPGQVSGASINAGQTVFISPIATLDSSLLSGDYQSDFRFVNDQNPTDPTDTLTHRVTLHDPPQLTDDSGATVQVNADPGIFIANAAAGPHAGAVRAGVKATAITTTGPFSVNGIEIDDLVGPGTTEDATVNFDRFGRLNGTYNGTASVDLEMVSSSGFFLFGAQAVPSVNWNLEFNLATLATDSVAVAASESVGPQKVGVNNASTAATLLDGESSSAQTISMDIVSNPEQGDGIMSADLASDVIDLDFSVDADIYVLQFTYLDGNVPAGFTESQLQLLVFDTLAGDWALAIDANVGGEGSTFFSGSYSDYLAGPGGGSLDINDLSAFGVDPINNQAWAVLNHASLFSLGVLTSVNLSADYDQDSDVDGTDFLLIQRNDPSLIAAWESQYGAPPLASSVAVPEPSTVWLVLFAGIFWSAHSLRSHH